ncbi:hypothetical protein Tco_1240277 [Tanacetum coccineum]
MNTLYWTENWIRCIGQRIGYAVSSGSGYAVFNCRPEQCLEVGWIRRIHVLDTAYWGFLRVGTTFDVFQNIVLIPYLEYGVFSPLDMVYQVVLDALSLTTCYPAFLIIADVLEIYMKQFWFTVNKKDSTSYKFKIEKKSYRIDMGVFREIFQIYPRLPNQDFDELPSDDEIVSFIKELGHKGDIKSFTEVVIDQMYQPWRTFVAIISKCLLGKITILDKLRLSRAQILWGIFYKKNVDFVELLWEDFTFQ